MLFTSRQFTEFLSQKKQNMTNPRIYIICFALMCTSFAIGAKNTDFGIWPKGYSPKEVGTLVSERYAASPFTDFGLKLPATHITYPEICTWFGALKFARETKNKDLIKRLDDRMQPLFGEQKKLVPRPHHVDATVYGVVPLELYMLTGKKSYLDYGLPYADAQWIIPENAGKNKEKYEELLAQGLSWQTRFWIDDMFMISAIQAQAYRATGDRKYIDRAAHEMVAYLDRIQQPNGLFHHAETAPFFWGRGNGWMAAGMTELLSDLPDDNTDKPRILKEYVKMMQTLKSFQNNDGLWNQLIDESKSWSETSSTAMFTYAMVTGVKKGWLNADEFVPVVRKSWIGLIGYLTYRGDIAEVCEGTNKENNKDFYQKRRRITGDLHGQAPILWTVAAFLSK